VLKQNPFATTSKNSKPRKWESPEDRIRRISKDLLKPAPSISVANGFSDMTKLKDAGLTLAEIEEQERRRLKREQKLLQKKTQADNNKNNNNNNNNKNNKKIEEQKVVPVPAKSEEQLGVPKVEEEQSPKEEVETVQPPREEETMDISALNSGRAVRLEPQFERPKDDLFFNMKKAKEVTFTVDNNKKDIFFGIDQVVTPAQFVIDTSAKQQQQEEQQEQQEQQQIFWTGDGDKKNKKKADEFQFVIDKSIGGKDNWFIEGPSTSSSSSNTKVASRRSFSASSSSSSTQRRIDESKLEEEEREVLKLERLVHEGFLGVDEFNARKAELLGSMRQRLALSRQRQSELKAYYESHGFDVSGDNSQTRAGGKKGKKKPDDEMDEQTLEENMRKVIRDEQTLEVVMAYLLQNKKKPYAKKSGPLTPSNLPASNNPTSKDLMYLLHVSGSKGDEVGMVEVDPCKVPQTRETMHIVEKLLAKDPATVRKFVKQIKKERKMRTEWLTTIQEQLWFNSS